MAGADADPGARLRRRLVAALVVLAAGSLLSVAAWMQPASGGLGTHEQLGLPECGWILTMNLPCPTCGMTTAFAHAADGNLLSSLVTQPMGAVLAVGTAMAFVAALITLVTGSGLFVGLAGRWWTTRTPWAIAGLLLIAWAWKMATHRGLF